MAGKSAMSGVPYNVGMPDRSLDLAGRAFAPTLADVVREARTVIGWSQRQLAARAQTSQAMVWRIESGRAAHLDLAVTERVLMALGVRALLTVEARHLVDRRRQRDGVHAHLNGYVARRLSRLGWHVATEVAIGDPAPRGWIDLLAYRPADHVLVINETKTDLPDMGGLQRSLAFYEREAWSAANRLGWRPRTLRVLVTALDTVTMARRLADNQDLIKREFPGSVPHLRSWLSDPGSGVPPRSWTLAMADPRVRGDLWLRPPAIGRRRKPPAYANYADAASRLLRS
jgi:transcriptional regulator with XRE-family HTH domain